MAKQEKYAKLCKEKMVNEIVSRFEKRQDFVLTSYMGSTVADLEALRRDLRKSSSSYFVVKNSILKIVFEKLKLKDEVSRIDSGMGISLSGGDIINTCKSLVNFARDHNKFKIKSAVIDGKSFPEERIKALASLPPRNVLIAQVVGGIKSPITGFVNVLGGVLRKFVCVVDEIKKSKQAAGGSDKQEVKT